MELIPIAIGVFIVIAIASTIYQNIKNPPRPVELAELPPVITAELAALGHFEAQSAIFAPVSNKYTFKGFAGPREMEAEIELDQNGMVKEVELEPVGYSHSFLGSFKDPELPEAVGAAIFPVLGDESSSFKVEQTMTGNALDQPAFHIDGRSASWKWEFAVTETGELLKVEKESPRS